jgi:hypothetical protein
VRIVGVQDNDRGGGLREKEKGGKEKEKKD